MGLGLGWGGVGERASELVGFWSWARGKGEGDDFGTVGEYEMLCFDLRVLMGLVGMHVQAVYLVYVCKVWGICH